MSEERPFNQLSKEEKIKEVDRVLTQEIRPMLGSHGGDIELLDVNVNNEVLIAYQGACFGCMASASSTLSIIEDTLKTKLDADLIVTPVF